MAVARIKPVQLLEMANCLAGDAVGDLVYCTGVPGGGLFQVAKADPNIAGKHPALAVITEKINATTCVIQFNGVSPDLYSGLSPGALYWLGASGVPVTSPVTAAPQAVGVAVSAEAINLSFDEDIKPTVGGGNPWVEDEYTPTNGQLTFILSQAPTDVNSLVFFANGVAADDTDDYTVSGTTVTWLNNWFVMDTSDKVLIRYQ